MFQIDTSTAVAVEPTPGTPGTPGYFTDGNPATNTPATIVSSDWFNAITDELLNILIVAGVTPAKATHNQVVTAIQLLISTKIDSAFLTYIDSAFLTYAGNPNGHVAGASGVAGVNFPSMVWDATHSALWVCTTTGTATTAVWTDIGFSGGSMPFWCGTSTGTANAQSVTPPVSLLAFTTGTGVTFVAGYTNTGAMTLTVGTYGTFAVRKDGPSGPIALTGGEVIAGNILTGRFDGTYFQLGATELGTAALANASSNTGTVAAVSGAIAVGHIAVFSDTLGTVQDSGQSMVTFGQTVTLSVANNNNTLQPGTYAIDTTGGAFSVNLALTVGGFYTFIDVENNWSVANFTVSGNGHNIGNTSTNVAATFVADVSDYQFSIEAASTYWRLV